MLYSGLLCSNALRSNCGCPIFF
uniref:Uncharacterized protein n=1 Tax=Arundo donax TaxID=35708 RepID=A0A0A9CPD7_ARUDO